jgi:HNH endonuclease
MRRLCEVCQTPFTKRRPNSCAKCYFKKRHQENYRKKSRKCISCGIFEEVGHNVYCKACKVNVVSCDGKHRIYFGRKFYKNNQGYWVCCKSRMPWAHRWVWENHQGPIPKNMDIHHIDGNKDNNEISNLELISRSAHQKKHWEQGDHDHELELRKETLARARKKI